MLSAILLVLIYKNHCNPTDVLCVPVLDVSFSVHTQKGSPEEGQESERV
jgi:hypothetical protein